LNFGMNIVLECKKIQYNELGYKVSSTAEVLPHFLFYL